MRTAATGDHWRAVYKQSYSTTLNKLEFKYIIGLENNSLEFNGGITAICGANGVGKTTILAALYGLLNPDEVQNSKFHLGRLQGSQISGDINHRGQNIERKLQVDGELLNVQEDAIEFPCVWIDSSIHSPQQQEFYTNMSEIQRTLDTIEPLESEREELKLLSSIVGKTYLSTLSYDMEELGYQVPYFKVSLSDDISYGSEAMGLGELSVHYIMWQLKRLERNSILLLEEPETYLSVKAQIQLLNVLAKYSEEKRMWIILTTHSPSILSRIPPKHVRFVSKTREKVKITTPTSQMQYLPSLGIQPKTVGILLVEDRAAREFVRVWINRFAPHLIHEYLVVDVPGGVSKIETLIETFPELTRFKILALLDGDQRNIFNSFPGKRAKKKLFNWPYMFLPGEGPPEEMFKQIAYDFIPQLAESLKKSEEEVHIAFSIVEGDDHHDWFENLHRQLGIGYEQLMKELFNLWIDDSQRLEDAQREFDKLLKILGLN
ncbi:AAA family ATPase [Bacillus sp. CB102A.1]